MTKRSTWFSAAARTRMRTSWTPTSGTGASCTIQMPSAGFDLTSAFIGPHVAERGPLREPRSTPSARPTRSNAATANWS